MSLEINGFTVLNIFVNEWFFFPLLILEVNFWYLQPWYNRPIQCNYVFNWLQKQAWSLQVLFDGLVLSLISWF